MTYGNRKTTHPRNLFSDNAQSKIGFKITRRIPRKKVRINDMLVEKNITTIIFDGETNVGLLWRQKSSIYIGKDVMDDIIYR